MEDSAVLLKVIIKDLRENAELKEAVEKSLLRGSRVLRKIAAKSSMVSASYFGCVVIELNFFQLYRVTDCCSPTE